MEFDTEDVQAMIDAETWESVIIHEMGHIIGKRKVFVCAYDVNKRGPTVS